ncbi:MAG: SOS response-associated peptidase family protein [Clostridia bacterium]|nr:SOS response-associated peptidase family protein [Clostridia bacterium]
MCCRYWTGESPEMREIVEEMNRSPLTARWQKGVAAPGEIRPTDVVPVIASNKAGARAVFPMRWGFKGKKLLLNARVETAPEKEAFRDAWNAHRCVVPAAYYFEWEHLTGADGRKRTGSKYRIRPKDSEMTWLCGLYRIEEGMPVFVVLTREAGESVRFIHDRMPMILPERCVGEWIDPRTKPERLVGAALTDMICERVEES